MPPHRAALLTAAVAAVAIFAWRLHIYVRDYESRSDYPH